MRENRSSTNDGYGFSVRDSLDRSLVASGGKLTVLAPYDRASGDVTGAVSIIARDRPGIVFMAGTAAPTAKFMAGVRAAGVEAEFATISFVGAAEFARQAGSNGAGVVISQVVPMPTDDSQPLSRAYLGALRAHMPRETPDFAMLEGYLTGRTICELLHRTGPQPSRENLLSAIFARRTELDISGFRLTFGPGRNSGSEAVFLTRMLENGNYEQVGDRGAAPLPLRSAS